MENTVNTCLSPCPVVFDLDGTLIDSAPDIQAAANFVLAENDIPSLTLEQIRSFIGGGVDLLWSKIITATGLELEDHARLVASFLPLYQNATALTGLYPGVREALGLLAERGHPLGLCTNKPLAPTRTVLEHLGITDILSMVIGGDSLPQKKPDPAPLLAAFAGLGAHPERPSGIYVGDSEYDATAAAAIPVPFVIFSRGYRQTAIEALPHARSFDHFNELPALIEAMRD